MTETREAVLCDRWADISGETLRWKTGDDCHGRRCSHTPPCRCAGCLSSSCISAGIRFYIKFSGQIISRAATTDSRVDSSANAERDDQYSFSAVADDDGVCRPRADSFLMCGRPGTTFSQVDRWISKRCSKYPREAALVTSDRTQRRKFGTSPSSTCCSQEEEQEEREEKESRRWRKKDKRRQIRKWWWPRRRRRQFFDVRPPAVSANCRQTGNIFCEKNTYFTITYLRFSDVLWSGCKSFKCKWTVCSEQFAKESAAGLGKIEGIYKSSRSSSYLFQGYTELATNKKNKM